MNVALWSSTKNESQPWRSKTQYKGDSQRYIHPQVFKMFNRAKFLMRHGDNPIARKLLIRCIELNPYDSHSWLALARLEARVGNADMARKVFTDSNEKCPRNIHLLHAWGHFEQKHGNVERARELWSQAYFLDPLNAYVSHALSNLERRLRNFDRAKEVLLEVFQKKPTAAICVALADLERQLGNPERARVVLQDGLGRAVDVNSSSSMGSTVAASAAAGERSKMLLALAWLQEDAFSETGPAFALIDEAFKLDPLNVKVHMAKASLLLRMQQVDDARMALQLCTKLCSANAEDGQHYTMWGSLELERGGRGPAEAQRILAEGAGLFPRDHFLLQRWGSLEAKLGRSDQARALFQRSAEIQPHAPTFVAWAILEEKESLLAFESLQSASVLPGLDIGVDLTDSAEILQLPSAFPILSPDLSLLRSELEVPSSFSGQTTAPDFASSSTPSLSTESASSTSSVSPPWGQLSGQQLRSWAVSKLQRARELFHMGVAVDPFHGPLYHAFGNMELRRGNITGARELFQRGIGLNCSDLTRLYHAWGLLELKDGHPALAADIFRKGIELGLCGQREVEQGVDFLFHSLGMLQLDTKQFAEAKKVFTAGVGLFPNHSHMLLGLALACMRLGQHSQARERFRMSVDCDSQHLHAWQSWAVAEKQLGNVELARILFREGLRHGPLHGALWQGYAVMEMQQGSAEIARTLFAEGIRRAPQHAQSYQAWACLEVREGQLQRARNLVWQGIKKAPPHAALWTVAGLVEDRLGDVDRAKRVLEEGISRFPQHGALYKVLGEIEMRQGLFSSARTLFSRGLDQDPHYAPVYHAAALLEARLGNIENLSQLHQKARHRFQTSVDCKAPVGSLQGEPDRVDRDREEEPELEVDERERERQDIIERIMQLEAAALESRRSGRGIPDNVTLHHQQFSSNSESFILQLGQPLG
eukprot:gene30333-39562_t